MLLVPQLLQAFLPRYGSELMNESDGHQCQPSRSNPAAIVRPLSRIGSGAQAEQGEHIVARGDRNEAEGERADDGTSQEDDSAGCLAHDTPGGSR